MSNNSDTKVASNFIKNIVAEDLKSGKYKEILTRFPPEPNGYLHIGHAKSIVLNFGLADEFNGKTNLRFDDTNPIKEDTEYVESIKEDVKWLGYDWDELHFASNYFDEMYKRALILIKKGEAYVCDLNADEIREYRGTLTKPGKESTDRNRTVDENLELFQKMRNGEFKDGEKVLRAKIDMASPNINLRDPVIYRIAHTEHQNTGNKWCVYPMYDFAHPIEDAIEGVTHSICTLEFEDHRPLYDWVVRECEMENVPKQIEFARLNITNTVMSKRKLKKLVDEKFVDGWDDPRMPTIAGLRRRGFTAASIRNFCKAIGVAKASSIVDSQMLDYFLRDDLEKKAPRTMAVLRPLRVIITNYPEEKTETFKVENNPDDPSAGTREVPFSRELYIEQEDFMENPPKKYYRLFPGNEVRLKGAYFVKCSDVIKDANGNVVELHCTYDPASRGGNSPDGRKVRGTIHWVNASTAIKAEVRLYEPLILDESEEQGSDSFLDNVNPNSLEILNGFLEPEMKNAQPGEKFQFFRHGYFNVDPKLAGEDKLVFNRIVSLKSSFKIKK